MLRDDNAYVGSRGASRMPSEHTAPAPTEQQQAFSRWRSGVKVLRVVSSGEGGGVN